MSLNEKLKKITSSNKSYWLNEAKEKQANTGARRNAWKIALLVLDILIERDMSEAELAEKMGVTRQQVTRIVQGNAKFTFEIIDKLEKALNVTLMTISTPSAKPPRYDKPVRAAAQKKRK